MDAFSIHKIPGGHFLILSYIQLLKKVNPKVDF